MPSQPAREILAGVLLALLAASLYTFTAIATRRVRSVSAAQSAMVQMSAGGLVLGLWMAGALLHGSLELQMPKALSTAVGCVLALGLVHTALMYVLMYGALQSLSAASIAILSFIYPAIALSVDLLWFGVRPGVLQWLGMALIALAIAGYRWQELRER